MTIGIIGPELSGKQIAAHLAAIAPDTEIKRYCREASADALDVIEECERECDAVLFTGPGPCAGVVMRHSMQRAYEVVAKDSYSLMLTFKQMQEQGLAIDAFSIDAVQPHIAEDAFSELELSPEHVYYLPFDSYDEEDYISWHQKLWDAGKISAILTGFVRVYHHFEQLGLPVFYLPGSRFTVRTAYNRLMSQMKLKRAKSAQLVVELLEVDSHEEFSGAYYSDRLKSLQTESFITEYCRMIEASFFRASPNSYIIFANRGVVKREENYQLLYKLQSKILKLGLHPNMGIGFGPTAYQAEVNAQKALYHAKAAKGSYIYSVMEDGALVGPLGSEQSISYDLVSHDRRVEELAKKADMGTAYISKLMALIQLRGSNVFDVTELADCLDITVRSAHRIMHKLLDADLAVICGKESSGAGRPKNLVKLTFGSSATPEG